MLRNNLAVLLELTGDVAGAETDAARGAGRGSALPQVSKNLGDLLIATAATTRPREAYERAAKLAPELGDDLYFKLGNLAYKRRDHARARESWAPGHRAQPGPPAGAGQPRDAGRARVIAADEAALRAR